MLSRPPTAETLLSFKRELWKDQRQPQLVEVCGLPGLRKEFSSSQQAEMEAVIIQHVQQNAKIAQVPNIIRKGKNDIVFSYIRGIRLFNLFVELALLPPHLEEAAAYIKESLVAKADRRQAEIQSLLCGMSFPWPRTRYPAGEKILSIIRILADTLGIRVKYNVIQAELDIVDQMWSTFASVPFRDATTKNMVLAVDDLWLGNFDGEGARREYIRKTIEQDAVPAWTTGPIVDFDFASCGELTTPEDDPISLRYHESTWNGLLPNAVSLTWGFTPNTVRAAITFLVRYYRFGGRKAAYRLLHPWGHRVRFRHDNDSFYFRQIPLMMEALWPDATSHIREILSFTELLSRQVGTTRAEIDLFVSHGLAEKRTYYVDMYPE